MKLVKSLVDSYARSFKGLSREIWLLALISLVNRAGTMVLPFLSIYLTDELSFSFHKAGIALSIFGVGSFLGSFFGGKLADSLGYYRIMFLSLITGGAMFLLFLFFFEFYQICIIIFLASLFGEAYRPAMMASISLYSTDENRTRSISLIRLAINVGYALGPALGGILAYSLGYESLFIIDALTCVSAAIILWAFLKEKTAKKQKESVNSTNNNLAPYKNFAFLSFLVGTTLIGLVFMQLFYTAPVFYKNEMGLNENSIGLLLALNAMLVAVIEMPLINSISKPPRPTRWLTVSCVLMALGYFVMATKAALIPALLYIILISFGEMLSFPYSSQLIMEVSHQRKAEYLSYYSMSFSLSHILAPLLGLKIAESLGFSKMWILAGLLSLVAAFIISFSSKRLVTQKNSNV